MRFHSSRAIPLLLVLSLLCLPTILRAQPAADQKTAVPVAPPPPADRTLWVEDALGQMLAGADVTLTLRAKSPAGAQPAAPAVSHLKTNEGGSVLLPGAAEREGAITVSHTDWGTARVELSGPGSVSGQRVAVPLVKRNSQVWSRALHGLVLGPDHQPVEGAAVTCPHVRTPGEGLITSGTTAAAVTDRDGHFTLYVPDANRQVGGRVFNGPVGGGDPIAGNPLPEHGDVIPANSHFHIFVEVPGDDSFFPYCGDAVNVDEAVIRLRRPAKSRTFSYETLEGGPLADPAALANIRLWYTPATGPAGAAGGERFALPARYVAGGKLAAGTYQPELDRLQYLPVEVKDDSPAQLTFHLAPPVTYHGRVVSGVTGEPMAGAFVLAMNGTGEDNLALLDADAWKKLHDLPASPPEDAPALEPLRKMYTFDGVVRTDATGHFELTRKRGIEPAYGLIVFEQDCLPIMHRLYATKADEHNRASVRDVPLFPAATVLVRPVPKDGAQATSVSPRWAVAPAGQPDWFGAFRTAADGGERQFQYDRWLKHNQKQPVFVPAGLLLAVAFDAPYHDEWSVAPADANNAGTFRLEKGATKDLGDLGFEHALAVTVRVVSEAGRPVEGAPVRRLDVDRNTWTVAHNSDAEGKVKFYVPPHSVGQFGVIDLPGMGQPNQPANLVCPYQVGGKDDPEMPYTIRMTRQQIEVLAGPKPREL